MVPSLISQSLVPTLPRPIQVSSVDPRPFVPWGLSLRSAEPKGQTVPPGAGS